VNKNSEHPLFIKQAKNQNREKTITIRKEATCYWLATNDSEYSTLLQFLPRFFDYDYHNHVLVLEYVKNSQDLKSFFIVRRSLPSEIARQQAELLASFHKETTQSVGAAGSRDLFPASIPAPFHIFGRDLTNIIPRNDVEDQVLKLVKQEDGICDLVQTLTDEWVVTSLIHGDTKPNNFLINRDFSVSEKNRLRLIDWELADFGDPLWDAAGVINGYLLLWFLSDSPQHDVHDTTPTQSQEFDLYQIQASITSFWNTYTQLMAFGEAAQRQALSKVAKFCAVQLLHRCYAIAWQNPQYFPLEAQRIIKLSGRMLSEPENAIEDLSPL
jgi:tRNA A-37 threonylcarbamoyl transferase component Bud32